MAWEVVAAGVLPPSPPKKRFSMLSFQRCLAVDFVLTVWFLFHSAANRKHIERHANLPVLTARKYM